VQLLMAAHFVGMFALAYPVGMLADRIGRRRTSLLGLGACAVGAFGTAATGSSSIRCSAGTAMCLSSPARGMTCAEALRVPLIGATRPKLEDFPLTDRREATREALRQVR